MELEQFIRKFEDAIEGVKSGSLSPNKDYKNEIPQWDSLSVLAIIAMIDSEFGVVLNQAELDTLQTIEAVFNFIQN